MTTIEIVMTIFCAVIGSTGIWNIVNNYIQRKQDKQSIERMALKGVLHSLLYDKCKAILEGDEVRLDDYDNLQAMYKPYHELGGNGTIQKMMEEIEEMPFKR